MPDSTTGLIGALQALLGGAVTTIIAALGGRLVYHAGEVKAKRRRFLGWELLWEVPVAVMMAFVGEAVGDYFDLSQNVTIGVVATLAYLGPRGAEVVMEKIIKGAAK